MVANCASVSERNRIRNAGERALNQSCHPAPFCYASTANYPVGYLFGEIDAQNAKFIGTSDSSHAKRSNSLAATRRRPPATYRDWRRWVLSCRQRALAKTRDRASATHRDWRRWVRPCDFAAPAQVIALATPANRSVWPPFFVPTDDTSRTTYA
jgi:hypothetical protein